jgi:hypothetical protein
MQQRFHRLDEQGMKWAFPDAPVGRESWKTSAKELGKGWRFFFTYAQVRTNPL